MRPRTYRILVTNDDGVSSPGLGILAARIASDGHDVVVAAPSKEFSGAGAAIGGIMRGDEIRSSRVQLPTHWTSRRSPSTVPRGAASWPLLSVVSGPRPDLVLSGINPGAQRRQVPPTPQRHAGCCTHRGRHGCQCHGRQHRTVPPRPTGHRRNRRGEAHRPPRRLRCPHDANLNVPDVPARSGQGPPDGSGGSWR